VSDAAVMGAAFHSRNGCEAMAGLSNALQVGNIAKQRDLSPGEFHDWSKTRSRSRRRNRQHARRARSLDSRKKQSAPPLGQGASNLN